MNSERWERISDRFAEARSVPPDRRAEFLDRSCGEDAEIRAEVERLLVADESSDRDGFMGSACPVSLTRLLGADDDPIAGVQGPSSGRRIGGYQLHGLIGQGGTSEVYEASGQAPGRFAFKLMHAHRASEDVLRRFRAEQDLLGTLDHPHIARFLDRGLTDDGLPYLVMELIHGRRIDRYCDERRLDLADRVRLLLRVCQAVAFLHSRGVLHRDLTPPNILVTLEGVPKLVDFGIAKSAAHDLGITISAHPTAPGAILGTPEYLSPEQAMGRSSEADPRTDVYILGVLLYRLIAGRTPFQALTLANLLDEIRLSDPVPPSRINAGIPRPLEIICLTCLQKDPRRRYATSTDLADDLAHWLDRRPIKARPVPMWVNSFRWCRRRPAVAALSGILALALATGFPGVVLLWRQAEAERRRAEEERSYAQAESARADEARKDAESNLEVASTMIGHLGGLILDAFNGSSRLQGDRLGVAVRLLREQVARARTSRGLSSDILSSLGRINCQLASRLRGSGRYDEALILLREQIDLLHQCRKQHPGNEDFLWDTVSTLRNTGLVASDCQRFGQALDNLDQATALMLGTTTDNPRRQLLVSQLSHAYRQLWDRWDREGHPGEAKRAKSGLNRIRSLVESEVSERPDRLLIKACVLADCGEWDRSHHLVRAFVLGRRLIPADPQARLAMADYLTCWLDRLERHGEPDAQDPWALPEDFAREFDPILEILIAAHEGLETGVPPYDSIREKTAHLLAAKASRQRKAGRLDEADRTVTLFTRLAQRWQSRFPNNSKSYLFISQAFIQMSKNAWKRNDLGEVRRGLSQSVEALHQAQALDPDDVAVRTNLQDHQERLAALPGS